ncbi:Uncharacterised protein [Mycoplasma putrefaciens]|nr:Uncharacterised protein [Mycoplasma putrefaciens]
MIYLLIALLIPYLVTIFVIQKFVPINLNTNVIVSFSDLLKVLSSSLLLALIIVIFLPLIIRPSVGVSLFLGLPIIKQIVKKQQDDNKVKRFIAEGIDTSKMLEQQELLIKVMSEYSNYDDEVIDQKDFKYLKHKEKPKIYTLKNTDLDPDQEKEIDSDF